MQFVTREVKRHAKAASCLPTRLRTSSLLAVQKQPLVVVSVELAFCNLLVSSSGELARKRSMERILPCRSRLTSNDVKWKCTLSCSGARFSYHVARTIVNEATRFSGSGSEPRGSHPPVYDLQPLQCRGLRTYWGAQKGEPETQMSEPQQVSYA